MFYETASNQHGLTRDPFKALVTPRPIGWISTLSSSGICNIAPYSFFNAISEKPHYVIVGSAGAKDTLRNIEETGEFVCSLATFDLRNNMNVTSAAVPHDVDEFPIADLNAVRSQIVAPPRVKESPAALECRHWKSFDLPPATPEGPRGYTVAIGLVVGVYIDEAFVKDGFVDTAAMQPVSRLGYMDYSVVNDSNIFTIERPEVTPDGTVAKTS